MQNILINFNNPEKGKIGLIVDFLKQGKIIVYPTDTIYGLGCLATDKKAIRRLRRIKQRDSDKPLLVLISGQAMLKKYFHVDKKQAAYLRKVWPGKFSVILNQKGLFSKELTGRADSPAVRLPNNKFLVKLIKEAGAPLVSTSLNLSGQESLESVLGLEKYFKKNKPDLIVDLGRKLKGRPSRLVDLRDPSQIIILRK